MATDNKTSVLVKNLLPDFLDTEGPKFQTFVKAYYEWMETTGQTTEQSKNLLNNQDIDLAAEEFLKYFKREILSQFPEDILADKRLVYKKIKDLYRSKGSEESYKLLFRILYNEELDFYYPGQDILRASDGRWIQETSIRITKPFRGTPNLLAGEITGRSSSATAKIERVQQLTVDGVEVYEIFVTNISGTFLDAEEIDNTANTISGTIISKSGSLQNVIITDGGSGHQRNDILTITSASGTGGRGRVSITANGVISKIAVTNTGSGFIRTDPLVLNNTTRVASNATGAGLLTAPISYTGRYTDVKGFISWSNKLPDNRYYQEYSYVLRSSQVLNTYKEIVKNVVHPAGMRLFGDVLINVDINSITKALKNEYVIHLSDIISTDIFIPTVVSASIDQYESSGDDGAVVPRPELEIEQIETFFDIDIPAAGSGFQLEIELIAAQTSALVDADQQIESMIQFLIEGVTLNTRTANLALVAAGDVWDPKEPSSNTVLYSNTGAVWLTANGYYLEVNDPITQLQDTLTVGIIEINRGIDIIRSATVASVNAEIMTYGDLPIYALEDKLQDGWGLIDYVTVPRTNIGTYSANQIGHNVADYDANYPGIPNDWTVAYSPLLLTSITSTATVSTDNQLNFEFNAFRELSAFTIDDIQGNTLISVYSGLPLDYELTIPISTIPSIDSELYIEGSGQVDINFVSNTIVNYQGSQISLLEVVPVSATGQRIWVEGEGTAFTTETSNTNYVLIKDVGNTGSFIYNQISSVADANTLILTSNAEYTVVNGKIFYRN
jgi:hypothetical protein